MSPQKTGGADKDKARKSRQERSKKSSAKKIEEKPILEVAAAKRMARSLPVQEISAALPSTSSSEALFSEAVLHSALKLLVERAESNKTALICADCNADPSSDECDLYQILPNRQRVFLKTVSKAFAEQYHACG